MTSEDRRKLLRTMADLGHEVRGKEIAEMAGIDTRTAGAKLGSLEGRGLIYKRWTHEHGGVYLYGLSEMGREEVGKLEKVTDEMVERFRESLWSTWGRGRQTTDWPSRNELKQALKAAIG